MVSGVEMCLGYWYRLPEFRSPQPTHTLPFYYSRARNYLYTPQEKRRESEFPPTGGVKQGQVF